MDSCLLTEATFDVASSAGWYSSIAGLLAGFAFVAVLLPLDHDSNENEERQTAHAVVVFVSSFFSLLILSVSYAILAGRTAGGSVDGVAAHEQMINGAAFGLSVLLLMFGLRGVLGAYGKNRYVFDAARGLVLVVTSVVGPAVLLALQFSNALDVERYRVEIAGGEPCDVQGMPAGVWLNLAIVLTAFAAIMILWLFHNRLPKREMAPEIIAKIVLGYTVAVVAWNAIVVPLLPTSSVTSALFEHLAIALTAVLTVAFSWASWLGR